jgi:hypothetical protein
MEENVCQAGHLPELYVDSRSEKYKIYGHVCVFKHNNKLTNQ